MPETPNSFRGPANPTEYLRVFFHTCKWMCHRVTLLLWVSIYIDVVSGGGVNGGFSPLTAQCANLETGIPDAEPVS
jgi:hypothetical protein